MNVKILTIQIDYICTYYVVGKVPSRQCSELNHGIMYFILQMLKNYEILLDASLFLELRGLCNKMHNLNTFPILLPSDFPKENKKIWQQPGFTKSNTYNTA